MRFLNGIKRFFKYFQYLPLNEDLLLAARRGDVNTATMLLNEGADIHASDFWGTTALIAAVKFLKRDMVVLLVNKGAKINQQDIDGNTALNFSERGLLRNFLISIGAKSQSELEADAENRELEEVAELSLLAEVLGREFETDYGNISDGSEPGSRSSSVNVVTNPIWKDDPKSRASSIGNVVIGHFTGLVSSGSETTIQGGI